MNLSDKIPMLNMEDPDFLENLANEIESGVLGGNGRNDRDRPYDGQPWMNNGVRGSQLVSGLTIRDLSDCLVKAMIISSPLDYTVEEFLECWDFSECDPNLDGEDAKPTQYLLDNQDKFLAEKVRLGTWSYGDVYKIDWDKVDPIAVVQNFDCEVEKMMGIFPNVPEIKKENQ